MKLWTDLGVLSVSTVQTNLFLYVVLCGLRYLELRYMVVYNSIMFRHVFISPCCRNTLCSCCISEFSRGYPLGAMVFFLLSHNLVLLSKLISLIFYLYFTH